MTRKKSRLDVQKTGRRRRKLYRNDDNGSTRKVVKLKTMTKVKTPVVVYETPKSLRKLRKLSVSSVLSPASKSPYRKRLKFASPSPAKSYKTKREKLNYSKAWTKNNDTHNDNSNGLDYLGVFEISNGETDIPIEQDNQDEHEGEKEYDDQNEDVIKSLISLTPSVVEELQKVDLVPNLLQFFRLVESKAFPLDNIAFLLWVEVVKWFSLENTSANIYRKETTGV